MLKLEDDCIYVGITSRTIELRYNEHLNGFMGAKWTKLHKPISIINRVDLGLTFYEAAQIYEQKITKTYIRKYGIDKVRGGFLTYDGQYKLFFGNYLKDNDFQALLTIIFLLTIILLLGLVHFIKR